MATTSLSDKSDDLGGYAVAVAREESVWTISALPEEAKSDLQAAAQSVREVRSSGAAFGLINIDDEFFVILRPSPSGIRVMLSDAVAALDYDLAADVLEHLNVDAPDIDDADLSETEPWGEGDMALLEDLGLPAAVLDIIISETDLYADEQLESVAERMGFDSELERILARR